MKKNCLLLSIIMVGFINLAFNQENEYLLKAGFMEKFARFTTWPKQNKPEFNIMVIGESPFNGTLKSFYRSLTIKNRNVKIKYVKQLQEIQNPDILFISSSENKRLDEILEYTKHKPILTIADTEGFAKRGVHINFYETEQATLHFKINAKAVKQSGLKIDALLLSYANIVK